MQTLASGLPGGEGLGLPTMLGPGVRHCNCVQPRLYKASTERVQGLLWGWGVKVIHTTVSVDMVRIGSSDHPGAGLARSRLASLRPEFAGYFIYHVAAWEWPRYDGFATTFGMLL